MRDSGYIFPAVFKETVLLDCDGLKVKGLIRKCDGPEHSFVVLRFQGWGVGGGFTF